MPLYIHLLILLTLLQIASCTKTPTSPIWNGKADTSWYTTADTSATEFTITTAEQLAGLAKLVNYGNDFKGKTINLGANIMLNDTTYWKYWGVFPVAELSQLKEWTPIGYYFGLEFKGNFNGNGYIVSGLYKDKNNFLAYFDIGGDGLDYLGLFGITNGLIENLGVTASRIEGQLNIGGLAGYNGVVINKCYFIGKVIGYREDMGGLVGGNGGIINSSYSSGTVVGNGKFNTGGLAGYNSGTISNSYSTSYVKGVYDVGGLVGSNYGTVENSYFAGAVVGELVGGNYKKGKVINSYSKSEMKRKSAVTGWDFENVWGIDSKINNGYPYLR